MNKEFLEKLSFYQQIESVVVVTVVDIIGNVPAPVGAKLIANEQGLLYGTVGGGKIEARAILEAGQLLKSKEEFKFFKWNLQKEIGMTCGGEMSFFFEKISLLSSFQIAIFGAGHVSQELVRLLLGVNCQITCIDPRSDWLDKLPNHEKLKKICATDPREELTNLNSNTFIVSMTMGHAFDLPILEKALKEFNFPYLGVIGSESKKKVLLRDLENLGLEKDKLNKIICPIGEDFGNNSPYEIALSVTAQLLKYRDSFL